MGNTGQVKPEYAPVVAWLLEASEPWVVYNTQLDLVGLSSESSEAQAAYQSMQSHPLISDLLQDMQEWPPAQPLGRAYDPKDSIWKLATLADFGLRQDDQRIATLAEKIFAAQAQDGGFLHGGFDHTKSWHIRPYICIAHVMTYALARFGYLDDARLQRAYAQIEHWQRVDGGWHPNKLNLPGEAREGEPSCPFGTVNVLRAIAIHPTLRSHPIAQKAADYILHCWERRAEPYRPVGFGIGSTWDKVQYPLVQYQLLKTVDTLSMLPEIHSDTRYQEMISRLKSKQNADGYWLVESVNKPWSSFDFGQKKTASPWVTFLALRVFVRDDRAISN
jgi:hypothetical protein